MATFPRTEPQILALTQAMIAGLTANAATYPAPPVEVAILTSFKDSYVTARADAVAAQAAAQQATTNKDMMLEQLVTVMSRDLRYAENTVNFDDDQLKLLGSGGRKGRTDLEPPGQSRSLEAPRQGEGWVFLDWNAPNEGG